MPTIDLLSKQINSSRFSLASASFDNINFRAGGAPPNLTLNADTPKGVLGGAVAVTNGDWISQLGTNVATLQQILGLYAGNSEGNPFENAPAPASGVVPILMGMGLFNAYVFETNNTESAYASIMASYTYGAPLYCSPFGLLTPQQPTTMATYPGGVNSIIATVVKLPTTTDLELGLKLLV